MLGIGIDWGPGGQAGRRGVGGLGDGAKMERGHWGLKDAVKGD